MNILLWIVQIALAWLCIAGGLFQVFKPDELELTVAAMRGLPHGLWMALGIFSSLAGLGLILPGLMRPYRWLVPLAAVGVALESLLVSSFYLYFGDSAPLPYSMTMVFLAAGIAFGRRAPVPA
jgi:uncharacterized membrane protein YphA (DoxX/SURF4 family)